MKKNRVLKTFMALLAVAALAIGLGFFLSKQQTAAPANPLENEMEDYSHMLDARQLDAVSEAQELDFAEPSAQPEVSATPEATPESSAAPSGEPSAQPTLLPPRAATPTPEVPSAAATKSAAANPPSAELYTPQPEAESTAGVGEETSNTQIVYFTTSILNGATLSARELEFTITHKQPSLTVRQTNVFLNDALVSQFSGRLLLEDGKNTVKVEVTYEDPEGHAVQVSKTYTVYVQQDELVITTDLKDCTVSQQNLRFTAYASLGAQAATLNAYVNGEALASASNRYQAKLNEGENEILLVANGQGKTLEERFCVTVELPENIEFITDLYDREVDDPEFQFTASIIGGTERAQLTVVANGVTLSGEGAVYRCTLARGNNLIRLKAADVDGKEYTQSYTVAYHRYIVSDSESADETMPRITTNISNGMEITGSLFTLMVGAQDGAGNRIYGDHLSVQLNGVAVPDVNEDTNQTYYSLDLLDGANEVVVTVWDYEDRYTVYRYTLYGTVLEAGAKKGVVTVSVEATTIGLGYLLSPTQVEIFEGENAVFPVVKALEAAGFEYQYSGSLQEGFYLAHLIRAGITDGWEIPADLESAIDEDGLMWTGRCHADSLGEFDFTQGSGWMYSVDGVYPGFGLSECYPRDGEHIRLRFTLAYGRDIGNAGESAGNYDQEW